MSQNESEIAASEGSSEQYVVFSIADEDYCIEILKVQEIIRSMPITWLPHRPASVEGVINLRGEIIPVINLRVKFGLEKKPYTKFTRVLIGQIEERLVGMIVDGVNEVVTINEDNVETAPGSESGRRKTEYIRGVARVDDRVIILLNVARILAEEEIVAIKDLPSA